MFIQTNINFTRKIMDRKTNKKIVYYRKTTKMSFILRLRKLKNYLHSNKYVTKLY